MTQKFSILIPTVNPEGGARLIQSFLEHGPNAKLHPQFVILVNPKTPSPAGFEHKQFLEYEFLRVFSDRHFGSCEENIYRTQDFSSFFYDWIFCIGEHDIVDWALLERAILFSEENSLDVCGWNILHMQEKVGGGYSTALSVGPTQSSRFGTNEVELLFSGIVLPARIAFPAILSAYGPIDWAAYIGSHLFKKSTFESVLRYRYSEYIYSFVFKQLRHFCSDSRVRYGFFSDPVLRRVAGEYLQLSRERERGKMSWLEEHRIVSGGSPFFWIALLEYINRIEDDNLFNLVTNSICYSHSPDQNGNISIRLTPFLSCLLAWASSSVAFRLKGSSYYLGGACRASALYELEFVQSFLVRLRHCIETSEAYANVEPELRWALDSAIFNIRTYLVGGFRSDALLISSHSRLKETLLNLKPESQLAWNDKSFRLYLNNCSN